MASVNITKIIVTFCVDIVQCHIDAKCNNVRKQNQFTSGLLLISVWLFSCLMSQSTDFQSCRDEATANGFMGGWGLWSLRALQKTKIGETLCWYKHDLVLH